MGDDDQNIYAFNGSSTEFIRRFEADYGARPSYLTENYRSTANIITAANAVIDPAKSRMKVGHPIAINRSRVQDPPGGDWTQIDPVAQGKVQILPAGGNSISQAQAVVAELKRLSERVADWDWATSAVVARDWRYLDPVRSLCELEGIPVQMANEEFTGVWLLRETRALVNWLRERDSRIVDVAAIESWLAGQVPNPWFELLQEAVFEHSLETGGSETPLDSFMEWLAEWGREVRRRQRGLLLLTAHRAKGLEFEHTVVLDGGWSRVGQGEDTDAPRRLYYVAMTRARETLTLMRFPGPHRFQDAMANVTSVFLRRDAPVLPPPDRELSRRFQRLGLRDVFLGFAGYCAPDQPVHEAIAALVPGSPLEVRTDRDRWSLKDFNGTTVGQLARTFEAPKHMRCDFASVHSVIEWDRVKSDAEFRAGLRNDTWEVVIPELVFEPYY